MNKSSFFFLSDDAGIYGSQDTYPPVDLLLTGQELCLMVEVPGIPRENLEIRLDKNYLEIKGTRCEPEAFKKATHFYKLESFYGTFRRRIAIPVEVEPEKIRLELADGILHIHIPRRRKRVVEIPVD